MFFFFSVLLPAVTQLLEQITVIKSNVDCCPGCVVAVSGVTQQYFSSLLVKQTRT